MPLGGKEGNEKCSISTVPIAGAKETTQSVLNFELTKLSNYQKQYGFWIPEDTYIWESTGILNFLFSRCRLSNALLSWQMSLKEEVRCNQSIQKIVYLYWLKTYQQLFFRTERRSDPR